MKNKKFFYDNLLKWNDLENKREMPWKNEKDPYKIWISEIILQQTRVQQGLAYYNNFIKKWPNILSLSNAPEQEVYKAWEGLGYYSRCRNIIATAKFIQSNCKGNFPNTYKDILSLKGIGPYTSSAIASFAFNLPYAVVDGNVIRVFARFFGIKIPVDSSAGKKIFSQLAEGLLDKINPGKYNQAIMDFGATICKPALPLCHQCALQKRCIAFQQNIVGALPVKEKKIIKRDRFFNYLIVESNSKIYVRQRKEKDIWQNLYEFILIETSELSSEEHFLNAKNFTSLFNSGEYVITKISKIYRQKLTHQTIHGRFFHMKLNKSKTLAAKYESVSPKELGLLPFPKFINSYLKD